jgi:hypothetical protein
MIRDQHILERKKPSSLGNEVCGVLKYKNDIWETKIDKDYCDPKTRLQTDQEL